MAVRKKQQDIRALLVEENEIIIDSLTEIMKSQGFKCHHPQRSQPSYQPDEGRLPEPSHRG
jgi:hypothetical protein